MMRRRTAIAALICSIASMSSLPAANAGLEFCIEPPPECDDGNPCTCDIKNPDGTCVHDPRSRWAAAGRAWGLSVDLGGQTAIPPTPDSNIKNPDMFLDIPADPLAHVTLLKVEEVQEILNNNAESHAKAVATTSAVKVLDQGGGNWLLTMDSLKAVSESFATDQSATSSTEGSTLHNVVFNGTKLGDVTEPIDFTIQDPILHQRIDVRLLQKLRFGAAAGNPIPDPSGVIFSGITVNAVRVTVRDVSDPANPKTEADIIIGHADSRVDRFSQTTCTVKSAEVSGNGYVVGVNVDETAIDPIRQLQRTRIGEVLLPSTGGKDSADLAHVGPILDPSSGNLVLESRSAFSQTEGQIDPSGSAQSSTVSAIEELRAFDQGQGPQIAADLVRAECTSQAGASGAQSTAGTTLVGLKLGGNDVCAALQLQDACTPKPNTTITTSPQFPALSIILNEQIADPPSNGGTGMTVNAIHVQALGAGNALMLPVGAEIIVSRAHCDAAPPGP